MTGLRNQLNKIFELGVAAGKGTDTEIYERQYRSLAEKLVREVAQTEQAAAFTAYFDGLGVE